MKPKINLLLVWPVLLKFHQAINQWEDRIVLPKSNIIPWVELEQEGSARNRKINRCATRNNLYALVQTTNSTNIRQHQQSHGIQNGLFLTRSRLGTWYASMMTNLHFSFNEFFNQNISYLINNMLFTVRHIEQFPTCFSDIQEAPLNFKYSH